MIKTFFLVHVELRPQGKKEAELQKKVIKIAGKIKSSGWEYVGD